MLVEYSWLLGMTIMLFGVMLLALISATSTVSVLFGIGICIGWVVLCVRIILSDVKKKKEG